MRTNRSIGSKEPQAPEVERGPHGARILMAFGIVALLAALYGFNGNAEEVAFRGRSAILWMVSRWQGVAGDLSHGWVIPLMSLFVVWRSRRSLLDAARQPSAAGLWVLGLALVLLPIGVRIQQTRISLLSLIGVLWGLPFYLWGWPVAKRLIFPCAYLLFCIPMSFLDSMTFPLRMFSSRAATLVLSGLGVPADRVGTTIQLGPGGGMRLDVADACSGLHYLLAMCALTAAYAYFTQKTLIRQWLLFLASVPLAMAGNVARIVVIGIAAQLFGLEVAMRIYHDASGYVVFAVAITLMIGVGALVGVRWREKLQQWKQNARKRPPRGPAAKPW